MKKGDNISVSREVHKKKKSCCKILSLLGVDK